MTTEPTAPQDEIHREIGRRQIGAGELHTALLRRHYAAPIQDVWEACTVPDRLNRWFLQVSGDLRAGGTFSLDGNASGRILRCEPPRLLQLTWSYADHPVSQVELRLTLGRSDEDTVLELEHAVPDRFVQQDGREIDVFLNDPVTGM